jgi:hypothetical protein
MNERIKEFYKLTIGRNLAHDFDTEYAEKFAELIVRDCLGIVNRKEYSYHEADPLWETAQLIKQHFGVTE